MSRDGPKNPPSWVDASFALFIVADISNEEVNRILKEAYEGSTVNAWMFWPVSSYSTAPHRTREGDITRTEEATEPPLPSDWTSPFKGKSITDCANFLKTAPDDTCIDWHHFAIVGEDFTKRGLITLCRIGDEDLKGEELSTLVCSVKASTLCLSSMEKGKWEEHLNDFGDEPVM